MTEIRQTIPATLEAVEPFLLQFRQCLDRPADRFTAELLLREMLANAVVHSSHNDPRRRVRCAVDWQQQRGAAGDLECSRPGHRDFTYLCQPGPLQPEGE
jgi:hypothetical protein